MAISGDAAVRPDDLFGTYISENSEAEFTHGLCPECSQKLYPGF